MPDSDLNSKAVIWVLWIGEKVPDFFSRLIQFVLQKDFSHNAFIFNGEVWHGTFSDDPKFNGFCNEPIGQALKGSVVRFCKKEVLDVDLATFSGYLRGRKGTPYSQSQNIIAVRPWLSKIPFFGRRFKNGKSGINCSEVVAEVIQEFCPGRYKFGDLDLVKPTDTLRVLKPARCWHNHETLI